jgi:uncharacterized sulfatase
MAAEEGDFAENLHYSKAKVLPMVKMPSSRLSRRSFLAAAPAIVSSSVLGSAPRPNILFAIADDQSFPHTSASGDPVVRTPAFDRVAQQGVRFTNAFCAAPGCAPSRAALLTGKSIWQIEEAGTHASYFPKKFHVYPDMLEAAGYFVGLTGKGAGPCNFKDAGWKRNPAGPSFDAAKLRDASPGVNALDYAGNFQGFLRKRPKGQPFCFWYGGTEPHRAYATGSGVRSGKRPQDAKVPPFLPDVPEVREDLLDYLTEIEHFDQHLGSMLAALEEAGELENTLVVVTADNGMAFPHAKATVYDYGIHLPLAIMWPERVKGGRVVEDMVSFVDFAPTYLEAAGLIPTADMVGQSLLNVLTSGKAGRVDASRTSILTGRERHSHARYDNLGYPTRAIRTPDFLYVRNLKPELRVAGDPEGYHDIDDGPSKRFMLENRDAPVMKKLFPIVFGAHPAEQLFDVRKDPGCLENVAGKPEHEKTRKQLKAKLEIALAEQKDPRMLGTGDIFDSYPRFSAMRPQLGGFAKQGEYNPKFQRR